MGGAAIEVLVLGELEVRRAGQRIALPASKKTRALLGYLVVTARPHLRDRLCDLLWQGPGDPRAGLRWSLTKIRSLLDEGRIVADRERVSFEAAGVPCDLRLAGAAVAGGVRGATDEGLREAADRFRGELLDGLDLPDSAHYHGWWIAQREAARAMRVEILSALAERSAAEPETALRFARQRLAIDPLNEAAHVAVVAHLTALGRRREAAEQADACSRIMERELGTKPSAALLAARVPATGATKSTPAPAPAGTPREERKLVSALVVEVSLSTASADGADPEEVRDVLRNLHDSVRRQIERYGGQIEKLVRDATYVVFGVPVAHVDDAERAVRCALGLVETVESLEASHPRVRVVARAAVATGEAIIRRGPAHEGQEDSLGTGVVLNAAARLQSLAPASRVVVGADTYLATRRAIRYLPSPPTATHAPSDAWQAIAPVAPGDRPLGTATIFGRDHELEQLRGVFGRVAEQRRPHLAIVQGPPGIGKSRLATEFAERAEALGARAIHGRCLPYDEGGYRATLGHVRQIAGILETDSAQGAREKLVEVAAETLPPEEAADVARYLSLLMGLGLDEPVRMRQPLFHAVRRLLEGISAARPTLVVLEDLHWADRSQLELLEYLCANIRGVAVLFLALARPELADLQPTWGSGSIAYTTIPLEPLSQADASSLVRASGGASMTPAEVDRLVNVSGGNPLFLEELAASARAGAAGTVPSSLREVIGARIDALADPDRHVLLDASVVGHTFWRRVLAELDAGGHPDLDASLDALARSGLVHYVPNSRVLGDIEFSFKHILIREVAYATLPRAVRRARHGEVARYLESGSDAEGGDPGVLAHHWREAGEPLRAIDHILVAAERARDGWAQKEATALFASALELAGDQDLSIRTRIRLRRGLSLVDLSDFDAGAAELEEILPDLTGHDAFEATLALARSAFWMEDTDRSHSFAERGRKLAERLGDPELVGPAILSQAMACYVRGTLREGLSLGDEARARWVPGTRPGDMATLYEVLAAPAYWLGDYAVAERFARAAYELGSESHSIEPLLRGGAWRGLVLAAQGRSEEAIALLDSIFERAKDLDPRWGAAALNYSSMAFRDMFMLDEARRRNERALEIVSARGAWGMPEMEAEIDLLYTDLALGEVGRVQRSFPRLWEAAINGKAWRPWLAGGRLALARAEMARQAEGPEATVPYAQDAIERARRVGRRKYEAAARTILGSALVELGKAAQGLAELRAVVDESDRLGSPRGRWQSRVALAKALHRTGDDRGTSGAYAGAAAILREYSRGLSPEHAAAFLAAEPVADALKAGGEKNEKAESGPVDLAR